MSQTKSIGTEPMPRTAWSAKDERQYEAIKRSCTRGSKHKKGRSPATCTRIAAATVNKQRAREGRTLSGFQGTHKRPVWLGALVVLVVALPVTWIAAAMANRGAV